MSVKADYTDKEWELLLWTPSLIGYCLVVATRSGWFETRREVAALRAAPVQLAPQYADCPLVQSLVSDMTELLRTDDLDKHSHDKDISAVAEATERSCGEMLKLLSTRTTPAEARRFCEFAYQVGDVVANTIADAEFLGIGGEMVSRDERRMLVRFRAALDLPPLE